MNKPSTPELFEYDKDIVLLEGAFYSAEKQLAVIKEDGDTSISESLLLLTKEKCGSAIKIIGEVAKNVSSGNIFKNEMFIAVDKDCLNRRMHASVFYSLLQQHDHLDEADNFFESVYGVFPKLSWSLYFELVKECQWSNYYIEIVSKLNPELTVLVLKKTLDHFLVTLLPHDSLFLHCILQVVLRKIYFHSVDKALLSLEQESSNISHDHCYTTSNRNDSVSDNSASDKNIEAGISSVEEKNEYENLSNEKYEQILFEIRKTVVEALVSYREFDSVNSADTFTSLSYKCGAVKCFLHALLVASDLILYENLQHFYEYRPLSLAISSRLKNKSEETFLGTQCKILYYLTDNLEICEDFILQKAAVFKSFFASSENFFMFEKGIEFLRFVMNCRECELVSYDCCLDNNANVQYLVFLISKAFKKVINFCKTESAEKQVIEVPHELSELNKLQETFEKLYPPDLAEKKESFMNMLISVIDNKYKGYRDSLNYLIQEEYIINESVQECLKRNILILKENSFVSTLMHALVNKEFDKRSELIQVSFTAFSKLSLREQEEILAKYLEVFGLCNSLMLPNFSKDLTGMLNQCVQDSEFETQVLTLCLQSPEMTVSRIVNDAMENTGQIPVLVQILCQIPSACLYKTSVFVTHEEDDSFGLLAKIIYSWFMKDLNFAQGQNLLTFITLLLQSNKDHISVPLACDLMKLCVLPFVTPESEISQLQIALHILQIILSSTLSYPALMTWMEAENIRIAALIYCLCLLLDQFIVTCMGKRKFLVVSILTILFCP